MPYFGDGSNLSDVPGVPSGCILLWSGASNAIPSGYVLCDNSAAAQAAGAPNLVDRFIVGAGGSYAVDAFGGSKDATLVSHTHSFSATTTGGNHNHQYIDQYVVINAGYRPWPANNNDCQQRNVNTSGSGSHSHSISGTTGNPSDRGTNSQGSSATNANLPPYYALAYIMKA